MHSDGRALRWGPRPHTELPELFSAIGSDRDNRAVILTGTGDAFIDMPPEGFEGLSRGEITVSSWDRTIWDGNRLVNGHLDIGVPMIAAVNGPVRVHSELALLCDVVLARHDTVFADAAHVPSGLVPGESMQVIWPMVLGTCITLVLEGDDEALWVSDPGFAFEVGLDDGDEEWAPVFGKGVHVESRQPRVVKMRLDGEILFELPTPRREHGSPPGMMGDYCPCGTAVDEERFGGNGDIWVADGYGSNLVHRFDKHGNVRFTLNGEEGGGRFLCPHAVFVDRRGGKTPELYIADRENKRVQVYDLQGRYMRTFGDTFLNSPSGFAVLDDLLIVAELYSRLAVVDVEDNFVGYVGASENARKGLGWPERPGWPNALSSDARVARAQLSHRHEFNSPHSLATDEDGNLYVSEWLIGGRYTKLKIRA
jgi:hypothetical protein